MADIYIQSVTITPNPVAVNGKVKIAVEIYTLYPALDLYPASNLYPGADLFTHIALRRINGAEASEWYQPFDSVGEETRSPVKSSSV